MKRSSATMPENNKYGAKAVIFTRVSSKEQEEGHSLNAQLKRLQEYCKKFNLDIIEEFEVSESSTIGDRKKFHEMIKFVQSESKKVKSRIGLVVDSVDRLQRSFKECPLIDDLIQKDVIEVHFYKEGFVLNKNSSSTDILRWDMSVLFAKSYVSALSENVKRGNRYALESGQYPGKPPIGYQKALMDNGKPTFILDKTRAHLIKKIFELYSEGIYSLVDLVKQCQEWNLTSNKSVKGKPLCKNTIDRILKDPFYYGEMYVKKYNKYYKHKYEPIIDISLFKKCQSITEGRNVQGKKQAVQTSKKEFIFRSLLTCSVTGRRVSPYTATNRHGQEYSYLATWDPNDEAKKHKISVPEGLVLSQISDIFKSMQVPEKLMQEITNHLQKSNEIEQEIHKIEMEKLDKRAREIDSEENELIKMRMKGRITDDKFDKNSKELEDSRIKINLEKEKYQNADKAFKHGTITAFQLLSKAYELFEGSKIEQKRRLINFVFLNLKLNGEKLEYTLRKPFDLVVNLDSHPLWRIGRDSNPRCSFTHILS